MPTLRNRQHEKFAQLVSKGSAANAAYSKVYGTKKGSGYSSKAAYRLMKDEVVKARVNELKEKIYSKTAEKLALDDEAIEEKLVVSEGAITMAQAHLYIRDVVFTPIGQVDENSPLCQSMEVTYGENGSIRKKIRMPDKLKALEMFLRMMGAFKDADDKKGGKVDMQEIYLFISNKITYGPKEKKADGREVAPVKKFGNLELTLDGSDEL